MRRLVLVAIAAVLAGCDSGTAPAASVTGTWVAASRIPGSGHTMSLTQTGSLVDGSGTYSVEAGRGGTFVVAGSSAGINVTLRFTFDNGSVAEFTALVIGDRMTGDEVFTSGSVGTGSLVFRRQTGP
jgi:hypothetical protein